MWHGSAGCEPPDQIIPRSAEDDENVPKNWGQGLGKNVWVKTKVTLLA